MNKEDFVPPQESLDLKELGFNEECFGFYLGDGTWIPASYSAKGTVYPANSDLLKDQGWVTSPLYQQAFKWFSKTFDNSSYVSYYDTGYDEQPRVYYFNIKTKDFETMDDNSQNEEYCYRGFKTHEEAELACIRKLIAMVKNEQA